MGAGWAINLAWVEWILFRERTALPCLSVVWPFPGLALGPVLLTSFGWVVIPNPSPLRSTLADPPPSDIRRNLLGRGTLAVFGAIVRWRIILLAQSR